MGKLRRTMLFMPGNNPSMLQNAGILGADSVILDLEDAVSPSEKDGARILVRNAIKSLEFYDTEIVVRINPLSTEYAAHDIEEIGSVHPHALMVSKATEQDILEVDRCLTELEGKMGFEKGDIKIFPLIETAYSLENIYNIVGASKRTVGVLLGAEDLTADLGIKRTKIGEEIFYARSRVASTCRAFGIDAIDTPFTDLNDIEGFRRDIERAKGLGFTGKAAINPRQVDTIHEVFAPSVEEIVYAQRVLKAVEDAERNGLGVFSLDGKMVDAPIISRAKTILYKASLMRNN